MTIWAAIPVKPIAEGKSRLDGALSPGARERLNMILFRRTLDTVAQVFAVADIVVVSRDRGVLAQATARGCRALVERGDALNDALTQAAMLVANDALLAISTDLPGLTADDVRAMLPYADMPDLAEPTVVIAPDRAGTGTNALFTGPARCIPFRFGQDSFASHMAAAGQAGITPRVVTRPGLAFDLDLPDDLRLCPEDWFSTV